MTKTTKFLTGLALTALPTAALAGTAPIPVPEPTTLGLFAMAAAGAAAAYRIMKR